MNCTRSDSRAFVQKTMDGAQKIESQSRVAVLSLCVQTSQAIQKSNGARATSKQRSHAICECRLKRVYFINEFSTDDVHDIRLYASARKADISGC